MVSLKVKVVTVLSEDLRQPITVQVLTLSQVYSHHKKVFLKQHLKKQTNKQRKWRPCFLANGGISQLIDYYGNKLFSSVINHQLQMLPSCLQLGLCVFLLKNKHFAISCQDVEGTPLCHHVNDIIKWGTVGNELVVQIIDGQKLFVWWGALPATKLCPECKSISVNSQMIFVFYKLW